MTLVTSDGTKDEVWHNSKIWIAASYYAEEKYGILKYEDLFPIIGNIYRSDWLNSYGVSPNLETIESIVCARLENEKDTYVVTALHVLKDPNNYGKGGGWRWHKWGEYIGTDPKVQPTTEYLDNEDGFKDGVWCYHIVRVPTNE